MKIKLSILLLAIVFLSKAQTHRYIYEVEYKKDSLSNIVTKENYHLDISGDEILYYTRDFFIADSLVANNIPDPPGLKLETSTIVKHRKGTSAFSEYELMENTAFGLKTNDQQNWQLSGNSKTENGLKLQQAFAKWGGRNWVAWFAGEIPFQEGPYKFRGLPGLIVELSDELNNYKFSLIKSVNLFETPDNMYISMIVSKSINVEYEKYKIAKLNYYDAPLGFIKNASGRSGDSDFFLNDGTVVSQANSREVNERLKKNIKNFNNPIDLTRASEYK